MGKESQRTLHTNVASAKELLEEMQRYIDEADERESVAPEGSEAPGASASEERTHSPVHGEEHHGLEHFRHAVKEVIISHTPPPEDKQKAKAGPPKWVRRLE